MNLLRSNEAGCTTLRLHLILKKPGCEKQVTLGGVVGQFEISLAPHFSAVIKRARCDTNRFNGFHSKPLKRF